MPFLPAAPLRVPPAPAAGAPARGDAKRLPKQAARSHTLRTLLFVLFLAAHVVLAIGTLLLRVVGLAITQLLAVIQRTAARIYGRRTTLGYLSDADSYASADEGDLSASRGQRFRAASAFDQSASLQRLFRRRPQRPIHVHHHHIHHRPDRRLQSRAYRHSLLSDDDAEDEASEHALDTESEDESCSSSGGTGRALVAIGDETPSSEGSALSNLALELHQMAMRAQAELDARLARCLARADGGITEPITEIDEPHDGCPDSGGEDTSSSGPCIATITSTDPSTPLIAHPITVPLRPARRGDGSLSHSLQAHDLDPSPSCPRPIPLVRSTTAQRRASAPDPILISPLRSDLQGRGSTPSEPGAVTRRESYSSSQGSSTGRRIRLTEPDWQPFVESHARARARVQLNALLSSARDVHSQRIGRRSGRTPASLRSSLEDSLSSSGLTPNSRSDLRLHALSAHALHSQAHAQIHTRSHARSHSSTTVTDDEPKFPASVVTRRDPSHASATSSTDDTCFSPTDSALSASSAVEEPDYWFERFFPGRAASGSEWDWRRPTPQRLRQERCAAREAARRAGVACRSPGSSFTSVPDERASPLPDGDDTPVLDQVAQLLLDPSDDDWNSTSPHSHAHPRRSVSRIVSQASAAAAVVASSAQVTAARTARGKTSPSPSAGAAQMAAMGDRLSLSPRPPQRYTGTRHSRVLYGSRPYPVHSDDAPPDTSRTSSFSKRKPSTTSRDASPAICAS